jgi:hypothetical protein
VEKCLTGGKFLAAAAEDKKVRIYGDLYKAITDVIDGSLRAERLNQTVIVNEAVEHWLKRRRKEPIGPAASRLSTGETALLEWWNNPPTGFDTQLRDFVKARLRETSVPKQE